MTFSGNHVDELISASLTGDLTDAERAEMDAHLARCERCRATLAAFKAERRILSGLPVVGAPRDLSARVRTGIDSGRLGAPWWRRPIGLVAIGGSTITLAAVLAILVVNNLQNEPVGQATGSPEATLSLAPSSSAIESAAPSVVPTSPPVFALGLGELGYLSLNGAPFETPRLTFVNDATGSSINAGTVSGQPIAASLSPDGTWLAYITQKGETGANEVWALHLTDGAVTHLGCSSAAPFTDRLAWSPESTYLGYTLVGTDLGPDAGCQTPSDGADVWLFDTTADEPTQLTTSGNAYAADFDPFVYGEQKATIYVSYAAAQPYTVLADAERSEIIDSDFPGTGMFLPLFSPDANRAMFWTGTMASNNGQWAFSSGGMPQVSGDFRSAGPTSAWLGTPLFTDLVPYGGEAFAYGKFTWGPDSDQIAFWDGAWTGVPQSADGKYPSQQDVYMGRVVGGLLSGASRVGLDIPDGAWIVDVALSGTDVAITIGLPSAGIGDPPSAYVQIFRDEGGVPRIIGGGVEPPPWDGPAVFGR